MRTFEEEYEKAIDAIIGLEDNSKVIIKPYFTTTAKTLGAEVYSECAAGRELIERFIELKHQKNLTIFFYCTNVNASVILDGYGKANWVLSDFVAKHPEMKLVEL